MNIQKERIRVLRGNQITKAPVVYWMSRDQRSFANWALLYAQEQAMQLSEPLYVVFSLAPAFLSAEKRHYQFLVSGLKETAETLAEFNIPLFVRRGEPKEVVPQTVHETDAGLLVTDFDPLRIKQTWKQEVIDNTEIPVHEVDAHNIIPVWTTSDKQEYAAHTIRKKIHRLLPQFLTDFPALQKHPFSASQYLGKENVQSTLRTLEIPPQLSGRGSATTWITPGETAAWDMLQEFITERLSFYHQKRNDPNAEAVSNLSPYLHFGHISAQYTAMSIQQAQVHEAAKEAFLEELIIRRELSDNFCYFNPHYDSVKGFPNWSRKTLEEHRADKRPCLYSYQNLEAADTHDNLWNAAQRQMMETGKMHGYMRMYWAKKILEWSPNPEAAMEYAIKLNNTYELDGRDPNGYTGIAWSIGGVHDRPWQERAVFGKVRYMNYNGAKRKFNVETFEKQYNP